MPVTLIVEDGTNVAGANTYATVAVAREYALLRGATLPVSDDGVASLLILAFDYIEGKETQYRGCRTYAETAFPRVGLVVHGFPVGRAVIPSKVIAAQCQAVVDQASGLSLFTNSVPSDRVIREKVGPLETEYADPAAFGIGTYFSAVENLLQPLMRTFPGSISVTRA